MSEKRYTPELITELAENEYFGFGSNRQGHHYGGAARVAHERFGAEWGVGEGITGQCYAFPTMEEAATITGEQDLQILEDADLRVSFKRFFETAEAHSDKTFLLTKVGTGVAGIPMENMRLFFQELYNADVHTNIVYPIEFDKDYETTEEEDKGKMI